MFHLRLSLRDIASETSRFSIQMHMRNDQRDQFSKSKINKFLIVLIPGTVTIIIFIKKIAK